MNGRTDLAQADVVFHGKRQFRNHISGVFGHDRRADNFVSPLLHVHFDKSFRLPVQDRSIHVGKMLDVRINFQTSLVCIGGIHAHVGNFG